MAEIVGTFSRSKLWDERANSSGETWNSSRGDFAHELLELAVRQLNRIEVGRVFWKEANCRPGRLNRIPNGGTQMDSAVIHHHNFIAPKRRYQALLDICEEHLSCDGTLNDHRSRHFIVPQGSHERDSIPRSKRNTADHSDATRRPSSQPCQVGAHCCLIDKYQPSGLKQTLL